MSNKTIVVADEVDSDSAWDNFLRARVVLLHAWAAEGVPARRMAAQASMQGAEHVERILSGTAVVQGPLEGMET